MSTNSQGEVTLLLAELSRGSQDAASDLFVMVYQELRGLAKSYLHQERPNHTLQPTALVHEAYMRLLNGRELEWQDRAHFFRIAGQTMRRVLVDHARVTKADKRGGEQVRMPVEAAEAEPQIWPHPTDLLQLDEALKKLERLHPRAGQIVELRYFGGLSETEAAAVLDISVSTLKRDWKFARAWLRNHLNSQP